MVSDSNVTLKNKKVVVLLSVIHRDVNYWIIFILFSCGALCKLTISVIRGSVLPSIKPPFSESTRTPQSPTSMLEKNTQGLRELLDN